MPVTSEALLPRKTGSLARLAENFRDTVSRFVPSAEARCRLWATFLSGPVAQATYAGRLDEARSAAQRLVNGAADESGFVWLIGAGPGAGGSADIARPAPATGGRCHRP
ncbi:hypothetical protein [Breoghania sp.]|uniref:hypothetical protein n=1 Tax=Breoghania sp. TaxID=2065378 RepID=UPI003204D65E